MMLRLPLLYLATIFFHFFTSPSYAHEITFPSGSIYNSSSLFLCRQQGIISPYNGNSTTAALLNFTSDFTSYEVVTSRSNIGTTYPGSGVIQSDGYSKCYLYFVQSIQVNFIIQTTIYALDFDTFILRQSAPSNIYLSIQQLRIRNQSNLFVTSIQVTNTRNEDNTVLLQPLYDNPNSIRERRIFFLKGTNIMFTDTEQFGLVGKYVPQLLGTNLYISSVSPNLVIYSSSLPYLEQGLLTYTFTAAQTNTSDSTFPVFQFLNVTNTKQQILGNITQSQFNEADILEMTAFLNQNSFTISIFANQLYWILTVESDYATNPYAVNNVTMKLPSTYAIGLGYYQYIDNSACLNYKYYVPETDKDGSTIYACVCQLYLLSQSIGAKFNMNSVGYQKVLNHTDFKIGIFKNFYYYYYDQDYYQLAIAGGDQELLHMDQSDINSVQCNNITFIQFLDASQASIISSHSGPMVEVICSWYSLQKTYVMNLTWGSSVLEVSLQNAYTIATICVCAVSFVALIGIVVYRRRRIEIIAHEYIQVEQLMRKFELTEDQFKDKFEILDDEMLGKGTFGVVKVCLQKPSRIALHYDKTLQAKRRAVKIINFVVNNQVIDQPSGSEFDEALILVQLQKYANAIRLVNYFSDKKSIYIVQELADSNLDTLMTKRINNKLMFLQEEIIEFCVEVGFLLSVLHNNEAIAHRDLKPQNILIVGKKHFRLSDFGAAKILRIQNFYVQRTSIGSLNWMSPEMYASCFGEYDPNRQYEMNYFKCDVFSLGLILLKLVAFIDIRGVNKFESIKNDALVKMRATRPELHPKLMTLIEQMLDYDPKNRIDMLEFKTIITETFIQNQGNTAANTQRYGVSSGIKKHE